MMTISLMEEYLDELHLFLNLARIAYIFEEGLKLDDKLTKVRRAFVEKITFQVSRNIKANLNYGQFAIALDIGDCLQAFKYLSQQFGESFVSQPD